MPGVVTGATEHTKPWSRSTIHLSDADCGQRYNRLETLNTESIIIHSESCFWLPGTINYLSFT